MNNNCIFRGVKVYLPSRQNIGFFKEFIDLCVYYHYNTVMIELGGAMEYKKHPEINSGWTEYCKKFTDYPGHTFDFIKSSKWARNSIHCENGGGEWLKQEEIKELINYCREKGLEIIPEVPSLSHSDYILYRHNELAENKQDSIPDTYCPSNPNSYKLLFDILDEIIELFQPKTINIGHDEVSIIGWCEKCKGKNAEDIYADDIIKIHTYLKNRGIGTMMWSDKLLEAYPKNGDAFFGGARHSIYSGLVEGEILHEVPATYKALDKIPNDIQIMHWYWGIREHLEQEFLNRGFWTIFGNFKAGLIYNWNERILNGIKGYCVSNWSALNKEHMQRNGVFFNIAYADFMANDDFDENSFDKNFIAVTNKLYEYYNRNILKGKYLEITHTTSLFKVHPPFVDGNFIDKKSDFIGEYKITYEDSTFDTHGVYYGLNIGNENVNFKRTINSQYDQFDLSDQLLEATGSCRYQQNDGKMWYTFCIAVEKNIKSIKFIQSELYKDCVTVREVKY